MRNDIFGKSIIAGGLLELNDSNIYLRSVQIKDNLYIHTCNDYGKSLEVIKEASKGMEEKVKIISKVYYKYPNVSHRRFRPIIEQLNEQISRLGFVPESWEIQFCCFCPLNELLSKNARIFFKKIKSEFRINKIYLETYPVYKYQINNLIKLNNFYKSIVIFGLIGHQNQNNRIFKDKILKEIFKKEIEIIFIGILGKGFKNIKKSINSNEKENLIKNNLSYFIANLDQTKLLRGITSFSSLKQYENFKGKFSDIQLVSNDKNIMINSKSLPISEINFFNNYDHYGGYFNLKDYFFKLLVFKIKYFIISFLKSIKFKNNFFG